MSGKPRHRKPLKHEVDGGEVSRFRSCFVPYCSLIRREGGQAWTGPSRSAASPSPCLKPASPPRLPLRRCSSSCCSSPGDGRWRGRSAAPSMETQFADAAPHPERDAGADADHRRGLRLAPVGPRQGPVRAHGRARPQARPVDARHHPPHPREPDAPRRAARRHRQGAAEHHDAVDPGGRTPEGARQQADPRRLRRGADAGDHPGRPAPAAATGSRRRCRTATGRTA